MSDEDTDHCGYVEDAAEFAEVDEDEGDLDGYRRLYRDAIGLVDKLRVMVSDLHEESAKRSIEIETTISRAVIAERQRDFLSGQIGALIDRLAGSRVAEGLISLDAARGFVLKEVLPINHQLAQIAAAQPPNEGV